MRLAIVQAKYCSSFQLTHMPRATTLAMAAKGKTRLLQQSQLSQHGEFWHVSVSEQQRSWLCGQNLRGPFVRAVLATKLEESARAMAADGTTKVLVSPPPRWVSAPNCTVGSLHDKRSWQCNQNLCRPFLSSQTLDYAAQFFPYQECNII